MSAAGPGFTLPRRSPAWRPPALVARLYSRLPHVERAIAAEVALRLAATPACASRTYIVWRQLWTARPWWSASAIDRALRARRQARARLERDRGASS